MLYHADQSWRGVPLFREHWLHDDCRLLVNLPPLLLFAGTREYLRMRWEHDADAWYEEQVALMRDRAPA